MTAANKIRGFTLIELLVVIAVVAALSALIISNLSNIKVKIRNTKKLSDINQYVVAIRSYYAQNGQYPLSSGWKCLGLGYPGYPNNKCWRSDMSSIGNYEPLNNALKPLFPAMPAGANVVCGNLTYRGYIYSGVSASAGILYVLEKSSQSCGIGKISSNLSSCTICRWTSQ